MSTQEGQEIQEETLGPGTDLMVSLFCACLVLVLIVSALSSWETLAGKFVEKVAPETLASATPAGVVVLSPVKDGKQYFQRRSAELNPAERKELIDRVRAVVEEVIHAKGGLTLHVTGHASPEYVNSSGEDIGGRSNFVLALNRAMAIAEMVHWDLGLPFECLRVHGNGRGESAVLRSWLQKDPGRNVWTWDTRYREETARSRGPGQENPDSTDQETSRPAAGTIELGSERRVVLSLEKTQSDICAGALAARPEFKKPAPEAALVPSVPRPIPRESTVLAAPPAHATEPPANAPPSQPRAGLHVK